MPYWGCDMRLLVIFLFLFGCQDLVKANRPYVMTPMESTETQSLRSSVLENKDYPIRLRMHADGTFNYDLPTLKDGEGSGTWAEVDGCIKLYAERKLFVMNMWVVKAEGGTYHLEFSDRFGPKYLPLSTMAE